MTRSTLCPPGGLEYYLATAALMYENFLTLFMSGFNKEDPLWGPFMVHILELAHRADTHEGFQGPWSFEGPGHLSPLHGW